MAIIGRNTAGAAVDSFKPTTEKHILNGAYGRYVAAADQEVFKVGLLAGSTPLAGTVEVGVYDVTDGDDNAPLIASGTISSIVDSIINEVAITPVALVAGRTYGVAFRVASDFWSMRESGAASSTLKSDLDGTSVLQANYSYPAASFTSWEYVVYAETQTVVAPTTSTTSGTITSTTVQQNIVDGGKAAKLTITGATFKAAGTGPIGSTADSQALLDGYVSAQSEAGGWDLQVSPLLTPAMLTRLSNTECELVLPAVPGYVITANETLTWTIPTDVLDAGGPIVSTPTQTILSAVGAGGGGGPQVQEQELILGTDQQFLTIFIQDDNGDPLTGVAWDDAGLAAAFKREIAGAVTDITLQDMVSLNAWKSGGFIEMDAVKMKGYYQFGCPIEVHAVGDNYADINFYGRSGMQVLPLKVKLVNLIGLGSDSKVEVSANAHTSGQTVKGVTDPVVASNMVSEPNNAGIIQNGTDIATNLTAISQAIADIATLSGKTDTLSIPKNAIFPNFKFKLLFTKTNQAAIGVTVTSTRNIDGADEFEDADGTIKELGNGWYNYTSTAADNNGDSIAWNFAAPDCNDAGISFQTVR